jgi:hypothetical protein
VRYQAEMGREAILEATGETFAALAVRSRDERTAPDKGWGGQIAAGPESGHA